MFYLAQEKGIAVLNNSRVWTLRYIYFQLSSIRREYTSLLKTSLSRRKDFRRFKLVMETANEFLVAEPDNQIFWFKLILAGPIFLRRSQNNKTRDNVAPEVDFLSASLSFPTENVGTQKDERTKL